jgi:hypothetical protein
VIGQHREGLSEGDFPAVLDVVPNIDLQIRVVVELSSLACLDHLHCGTFELIVDVDVALGSGNAFVPSQAC